MAEADTPAIAARELTKRFGDQVAVDGVSFEVRQGEVFGFLGPNGAGKTTTINLLTGLARADFGSIHFLGRDYTANVKKAQHLMGVVPDESNLYPELSGHENLSFCGALYGMARGEREPRARELLHAFGLSDVAGRKFAAFSKGMKRKLAIAAGIIHRPRILFLDEPTTGIDVSSARHIRQFLAGLKKSGTTVFLTTHYIEEAERLCDRIGFLVAGRIVQVDTVEGLLQPVRDRHSMRLGISGSGAEACRDLAPAFPALQLQAVADTLIEVESTEPVRVAPLVRALEERGIEVREARKVLLSLEDVFVRVTGIEAETMRKEKEKRGAAA